jgi:hypothetical protein
VILINLWIKGLSLRETISFVIAVEIIKRIPPPSHYSVKLLEIEHSVTIPISLLKHLLELIIRDFLTNLSCDSLQVFESYFVQIIFIEEFKDLKYFVFGISWALDK